MGLKKLALFHALSALGCWAGYFKNKGNENGN